MKTECPYKNRHNKSDTNMKGTSSLEEAVKEVEKNAASTTTSVAGQNELEIPDSNAVVGNQIEGW